MKILVYNAMLLIPTTLLASVHSRGDDRCHNKGGYCQRDSLNCPGSGSYKSGLCSGARNRRCCIPRREPKCEAVSGTCQVNSVSCSGQYRSGLCYGPSNRKCCVPRASGGNAACGASVKRYACDIKSLFQKGKIALWNTHQSGKKDNAYARNNIVDTCDGKKASRSSYGCRTQKKFCNAPGGTVCLNEKILKYIKTLGSKGYIHVNEIAGACHSCTSKHYDGRAVDIHISKKKTPQREAKRKLYMDECTKAGGWALDEKHHIHCQF